MLNKNSWLTRLSILSISLLLTSATSINGALPQMRKSLLMTTTQGELIATLPALAVVIFVLLSSFIAGKIGTKKTIQIGLLLVIIGGSAPLYLQGYYPILISRFILGAGFGLFNSLAVSIINILFLSENQTRASLLGYRGAAENIGNAVLTLLAGFFLTFGWRFSFSIYLLAIPVLILFTLFVPEMKEETKKDNRSEKGELKFSIYLLALFALFIVMTFIAIGVRFPTMAADIKGIDYNASNFLAVMPIISIVTGSMFGFFNRLLGNKCLYLGLALLALATFLISISQNNFSLLLVGYFISGIPGSLIFPFIYNSLNLYATPRKMNVATSIILIGCNLGNFVAPFGLRALQTLSGSQNDFAPFKLLSLILVLILVGIVVKEKFQRNERTSESNLIS